jgi:hypothetical protein
MKISQIKDNLMNNDIEDYKNIRLNSKLREAFSDINEHSTKIKNEKISNIIDALFSKIGNYNIELIRDGILSKILSVIIFILLIPFTILKTLILGAIGLISAVIRLVVSIIKLSILTITGIQGSLIIIGLFLIFMGWMSKIGLNIITKVASPVFSFILFRIIPNIGKMLGGITQMLYSILALIVIFAIPIAIALIVFLISTNTDGGEEQNLLNKIVGVLS